MLSHLQLCQCFTGTTRDSAIINEMFKTASYRDLTLILRMGYKPTESAYYAATFRNNAVIFFSLLFRHKISLPTDIWNYVALHEDCLELVELIVQHYGDFHIRSCLDNACKNLNMELTEWAIERLGYWPPEVFILILEIVPKSRARFKFIRWASVASRITAEKFITWAKFSGFSMKELLTLLKPSTGL